MSPSQRNLQRFMVSLHKASQWWPAMGRPPSDSHCRSSLTKKNGEKAPVLNWVCAGIAYA